MTEAQRKRTLKDGQEAGEMLLDIETRIGEMLPPPEEARKTMIGPAFTSKERRGRPKEISEKRAYQSRAIAKHPDIVEKVKAQARENEKKVENLLFVVWVQDQRHDFWMKVIKEIRAGLEELREEMWDGRLFHSD